MWKTELWVSAPEARVILVGTKVDRDQDRVISSEVCMSAVPRWVIPVSSKVDRQRVSHLHWGVTIGKVGHHSA